MIATDRWLEMDLTWFQPEKSLEAQLDTLFDRVAPLLNAVSGERGLMFNLGWLIDVVTEWTGDPAQKLPLHSRRTAPWSHKTYGDLRAFVNTFRSRAVNHGFVDLKIGILFVGWSHVVWPPELKIYDFESDWYARHPELYGAPKSLIGMPDLHPHRRLHADTYPYAAFPNGLAEETYFPDFFGAQWGSFARAVGFDVLLLRDGLMGPMIYTRNGPFGTRLPADPAVSAAFSQAVRDLYRAVKQAAPEKLVFGYSSAISPIADWRVGAVDFEALVADGFIDGWIEQTWGGAWQDWWHQLWKGWTFQMANLLTRGAMIAAANQRRRTPCRYYCLIETWDGWEPWDTLHQVPNKLRWAMWAFTHAAVTVRGTPQPPSGAYISWMNNGEMTLLSDDDITWLNTHLSQAQANAASMEDVFGWSLVYHRAAMEWLSAQHPDWNVSEWLDDQAAMLMKWGIPIGTITRGEWLADTRSLRPLISGVAGTDPAPGLMSVSPLMLVGRADLFPNEVLARAGVKLTGDLVMDGFHVAKGEGAPPYDRPYLPEHADVNAAAGAETLYATDATPLLITKDAVAYWQPPDWSEPFNQFVPKYQLGSTFPHYRAARLLQDMAHAANISHLDEVAYAQPVAFHLWRSDGAICVLLGNLETGVFGDARMPREVNLCLSRAELGLEGDSWQLVRVDQPGRRVPVTVQTGSNWLRCTVVIAPEDSAVYRLERSAQT